MSGAWFTEPGTTGTVTITGEEGSWFVKEPITDNETKCILKGEFDLDEDASTHEIEITISKFMRAGGQGPNFLFATPSDGSAGQTDPKDASSGNGDGSSTKQKKTTDSGSVWRSLSELSGSGDYVTVQAVVDSIFWVKKDTPNVPDIVGSLVDEETGETRMYVVNEGVKHPYLEEGRKFVFIGAKDHYYEKQDKVQLMITRYTDFTDKGLTDTSSHSTKDSRSGSNKKSNSDKSLRQIANEMLGGKEFKVTQQNRDSAVGKAKKRARRQQRDPAIDPRLQDDR